jgi:hypothetical protein
VAWTALQLVPDVPGCGVPVVFLFAVLHDAMRADDGFDSGHGPRAAGLAGRLHGSAFRLGAGRLETLQRACRDHTAGRLSGDPTVGAWSPIRLPAGRGITSNAAPAPRRKL